MRGDQPKPKRKPGPLAGGLGFSAVARENETRSGDIRSQKSPFGEQTAILMTAIPPKMTAAFNQINHLQGSAGIGATAAAGRPPS
jgi:hypothetical protein